MTVTMPMGVARVTVVAPYTRVDVALPHTATLAELLPTLLKLAGEDVVDSGAAHGGWALARLGERPLDSGHTIDALGIRDGDVLHLRPRRAELPTPVFDDVVDAIATTTRERAARWQPANTRRTGLVIGGALLSAGVLAPALAGTNRQAAALIAAAVAALLLLSGAGLARALQDSAAGAVSAGAGLAYAFVAGLVATAPGHGIAPLGRTELLLACSALLVAAVLAAVLVGDFTAVFGAAAAVGLLGCLCVLFTLLGGVSTRGGAAVAAALTMSAAPVLPILALRLARLPLPTVAADASDMTEDESAVPGPGTTTRAEQAESHLTGLLTACCVVLAGAQVLLVGSGRTDARVLCAVVAAALLLRSRYYADRAQRLVLLATGLLGAVAVVGATAAAAGGLAQLLGGLGALLIGGATAVVVALAVPGRPPSPYAARALDIVEIALLVSIIPLAMGVLGAYSYVRGLGG
ncbi:MAG: type VII secretion integral membrane protein EccD [Pseudonocardiales bacterium]